MNKLEIKFSSLFIIFVTIFSVGCSNTKPTNRNERTINKTPTNCDSIIPYASFGTDNMIFKEQLKLIAEKQLAHNDSSYNKFKQFVDTSLTIRDVDLVDYYNSLKTKDYLLVRNFILLFTDTTVKADLKFKNIRLARYRFNNCFWMNAMVAYYLDVSEKKLFYMDCYYQLVQSNSSQEFHILFLKMLIANYEKGYGDMNYSTRLRKELIKQNFFKSYNQSKL